MIFWCGTLGFEAQTALFSKIGCKMLRVQLKLGEVPPVSDPTFRLPGSHFPRSVVTGIYSSHHLTSAERSWGSAVMLLL